MKCPVCQVEIPKNEKHVVVRVPVEGQLVNRRAHEACVEAARTRTTSQRP